MIKLVIDQSTETTVTREATEDRWDADDLQHSTTIHGFRVVTTKDGYFDFVVAEPLRDSYYLVCVEYSTGDSFHHETGRMALVALLETREGADTVIDAIRRHPKNYSFTVAVEGQSLTISTEWVGYFERIEAVYATEVSRTE